MKKKLKKLTLNRETIVNLQEPALQKAVGGASYEYTNCFACSTPSWCRKCAVPPPSHYTNCESWEDC